MNAGIKCVLKGAFDMTDKNGIEIRQGDVVAISEAFVRRHNDVYFVEHSPGDPDWCGDEYCLRKILKDGRLRRTAYGICFWPILNMMNDKEIKQRAKAWNQEHATIEVINDWLPDHTHILEFFRKKEMSFRAEARQMALLYGKSSERVRDSMFCVEHYVKLQDRLRKERGM